MKISTTLKGQEIESYPDSYHQHILEQYKLYVEMADRISMRRQSAHNYMLALHSLVLSLAVVLYTSYAIETIIICCTGMVLCVIWYRLVLSYRQLNTGKFKVVHQLEALLPVKPYDAEWVALGQGENKQLYRPFSSVELLVPRLFGVLYATGIVLHLLTFMNLIHLNS